MNRGLFLVPRLLRARAVAPLGNHVAIPPLPTMKLPSGLVESGNCRQIGVIRLNVCSDVAESVVRCAMYLRRLSRRAKPAVVGLTAAYSVRLALYARTPFR